MSPPRALRPSVSQCVAWLGETTSPPTARHGLRQANHLLLPALRADWFQQRRHFTAGVDNGSCYMQHEMWASHDSEYYTFVTPCSLVYNTNSSPSEKNSSRNKTEIIKEPTRSTELRRYRERKRQYYTWRTCVFLRSRKIIGLDSPPT